MKSINAEKSRIIPCPTDFYFADKVSSAPESVASPSFVSPSHAEPSPSFVSTEDTGASFVPAKSPSFTR